MTPSQLDHLRAIDAHLANLLENAKERSPGRWEHFQKLEDRGSNYWRIRCYSDGGDNLHGYCGENNAAFIASCAGDAEAGWESTRILIASIFDFVDAMSQFDCGGYQWDTVEKLLAQWPLELLATDKV